MSHPSLVSLDGRSVPRRLMAGESVCEVALPVGTRVVYPRPAQLGLRDPVAAIARAFDQPLASEPLSSRLTRGMRLVVAVEALYHHSSPAGLFWLGRALREVLSLAAQRGVAQATVLLATGIHRRLFADEKKLLVASGTLPAGATLIECDPEGPVPLHQVAEYQGEAISIHPEAASADLVVTLSVTSSPVGGGYGALVLGLGGYPNARAAARDREALWTIGGRIEAKVPTFAIELVLDSRHENPQPEFLGMNEDDLTNAQRVQLKGFSHLPKPAASRLASDLTASAGLLGVYCGSTALVHNAARNRHLEQHVVPLTHPADVLVTGLPAVGPFNARAALNPVLIRHLLQGWLLQQYRGAAVLRSGGTVILLHPCTHRFDHQQHTAHYNFFNSVLPKARTPEALAAAEAAFVRDPALLTAFRTGHAYHPGHPFLLWQQAEQLTPFLGRVIVVGADNESIPKVLGYETAASLPEALYRARNGQSQAQDVLCLHNPLTVVCKLPEATS